MTRKEREEYKAWLASLKVGDEVGVQSMEGAKPVREPRLDVVDRVWKDGSFSLLGQRGRSGSGHNANGRRPKDPYGSASMMVYPTNDMRRRSLANGVRARLYGESLQYWSSIPDDKALRIVAILDEPETTTEGKTP